MDSPKELFYDAIYRGWFWKAYFLLRRLKGKSKERAYNYFLEIYGKSVIIK